MTDIKLLPDSRGSSDAFAEVSVDGRPGDGLEPLDLPRRVHVELLDKVVDQADGEDDHDEEWHGGDHHDDRPDHAHAGVDQHPDVHRDLEIDIVNVFGESVEDAKH